MAIYGRIGHPCPQIRWVVVLEYGGVVCIASPLAARVSYLPDSPGRIIGEPCSQAYGIVAADIRYSVITHPIEGIIGFCLPVATGTVDSSDIARIIVGK